MVRPKLPLARWSKSAMSTGPKRVQRSMGDNTPSTYSGVERRETPSLVEGQSMTRQAVVWVTNMGGHPYSKAEQFGRLMSLTEGNVNFFNLGRLMVSIAPKLRSAIEDDYVLISGTPIITGLIMTMWLSRFPKINLLQWSQGRDMYIPIELTREAVERMSTQDLEQSA